MAEEQANPKILIVDDTLCNLYVLDKLLAKLNVKREFYGPIIFE